MIYRQNKVGLPRMHQIIVVAGTDAVELNLLNRFFFLVKGRCLHTLPVAHAAIKYLTVF